MASPTPNRIINNLKTNDKWEQTYGKDIKTPLDEFKNYESFISSGPDFFESGKHYGAPLSGYGAKYSVPYSKLIDAYSKSKGKFADKALTDPEIKKYHDERMAQKNALFDRVRKVPAEKRVQFLNSYGPYSDPFDYEGEPLELADEKSINDFLENFEYGYQDWETLKNYLDEMGY